MAVPPQPLDVWGLLVASSEGHASEGGRKYLPAPFHRLPQPLEGSLMGGALAAAAHRLGTEEWYQEKEPVNMPGDWSWTKKPGL